jgi:putative protein-disulfide isomerase
MTRQLLWYLADPMCSWCWGFAPAFAQIRESYGDRLEIGLILGGLRPGEKQPIEQRLRAEILHHWHDVHDRTGQPFRFEGAMPDGFVYDTEIPSRAVVAVSQVAPEVTLPYFEAVQAAFYAEGRDVTRSDSLSELAAQLDVEPTRFRESFESKETKAMTQGHFSRSRQLGVRGFPTVIVQNSQETAVLTSGYQPFQALRPLIDGWLKR